MKYSRILRTASMVADSDPDSSFVLAYDSARHALTALLVQQGLRPTSKGGHYALEVAIRAQFGHGFRQFGAMRRRRNELEYPEHPDQSAQSEEVVEAIANAQQILADASELVDGLGLF